MRRTYKMIALAVLIAAWGCDRPIFDRPGPLLERRNPAIAPGSLQVLGTVAGGRSRPEIRMSVTIRQQLADSGLQVVPAAGRWESQIHAVREVCAPGVQPVLDGVLFVFYNRLELFDCDSKVAAYEISGGGLGINQMADRLVAYLKGSPSAGDE